MSEDVPKPHGLTHDAHELVRIHGVFMYYMNKHKNIGAILGYHLLRVVLYQNLESILPCNGYLNIGNWIYPLVFENFPIYIWNPNKLIMIDPFSSLAEPEYVIIQLPLSMCQSEKNTLWTILNKWTTVKGSFAETNSLVDNFKEINNRLDYTKISSNDISKINEQLNHLTNNKTNWITETKYIHKLILPYVQEMKLKDYFKEFHNWSMEKNNTELNEQKVGPENVKTTFEEKEIDYPSNVCINNNLRLYLAGPPDDSNHIQVRFNLPKSIDLPQSVLTALEIIIENVANKQLKFESIKDNLFYLKFDKVWENIQLNKKTNFYMHKLIELLKNASLDYDQNISNLNMFLIDWSNDGLNFIKMENNISSPLIKMSSPLVKVDLLIQYTPINYKFGSMTILTPLIDI